VDNTVLVRIERPSAIPIESLHGRKEDAGRTLRLNVRAILGAADLGEFSLRPQQGAIRAVFVPLARLQQDLQLTGRVNTLLVTDRGDAPGAADGLTVAPTAARGFQPHGQSGGTLDASIRRQF